MSTPAPKELLMTPSDEHYLAVATWYVDTLVLFETKVVSKKLRRDLNRAQAWLAKLNGATDDRA